jgi:5,10-methylenetetrahydrofolate reductase
VKHGVKYIHFYTMNRSDSVVKILNATGMGRRQTPIAA